MKKFLSCFLVSASLISGFAFAAEKSIEKEGLSHEKKSKAPAPHSAKKSKEATK